MYVESLGKLDADLLEQLGVASLRYWRSELERHHVAQLRQGTAITYLIARHADGNAVGMLPVYTAAPPFEPIVDPASIFYPPMPVTELKMCFAGSPGAYANYLSIGASVRTPDAVRVAAALVEQVRVLARDAGCPYVLLPYLDEAQSRWLDGYLVRATAVSTREKAVLSVVWDSFDDYLSWLPSKRRREVRRERRAFDSSGVDVREERLVDVAADLAPLMTQTENRYGRDVTPEQMEFYLMLLGMNLDDDCISLVAYRNDRPVAFSLALVCEDRWIMRSWGCDYTAMHGEALYFNLVYYEPVVRAIERGVKAIDYGVGALQAKRLRGCDVQWLRTLLIPSAIVPSSPPGG